MKNSDNILEISDLHPDFMGFIFYKNSPRFVSEAFMMPAIDKTICKTGVFVDEAVEQVLDISSQFPLEYVQLHGSESVSYCEELKSVGVGVIKAFAIDEDFNFNITRDYEHAVDLFLFDTKGKNYGGNGFQFNWILLNKYNQRVPFFVSGGISPDNVEQIHRLKDMNVFGVDVNSGVEIEPGMKNVEQIKSLIEILKAGV